MKKLISLIMVLVLGAALACPALASGFVPSVGDQPAPKVESAEIGRERIEEYLAVTSVLEASEKTENIAYNHQLLLEVYDRLVSSEMKLPIGKDYSVRELVDLSCVTTDRDKKDEIEQWLAEDGNTITLTFDLGVDKDAEVTVLVFVEHRQSAAIGGQASVEGEWQPAVRVKNNGDGTVTCELENIGLLAFGVSGGGSSSAGIPEDTCAIDISLWVLLIVASSVSIVLLVIYRRKHVGKYEEAQVR